MRDEEAVRRYVERLALVLTQLGIQRMAARVVAALMVTDDGRLTAGELAEKLQVSPAAVSGAVRYLEQVGLVERQREPGERRDHFRVLDDLWYASMRKRDRFMEMWRDAAEEGVDAVGADTPAGRRLADTRDFLSFIIKELPLLFERWEKERASSQGVRGGTG
ncbi:MULTISPECIES: GbsR/MarR family transcriptional regulator [Amycolatopsis]|uniref:MarR family transcriptional regulator n=1 Tax=Amycolatopsis thermalba TaxID=944492 RepID=A0ABY4NNA9_9PSEU|nr:MULTISPECIES: MarR family transcriptional regulator [Amycolatopsis]OXM62555.1 MarR family transcriptional regulator [Amycolatopsis sp. KNN50.9b]UQS22068.1 MarR family transcriptional regulator [Amycolatopsis thermalba]